MSTPLATYAETSQAEHRLSIDWEFTADGTPIGYDDGAQYDSIRSTITARLTPAQVQEVLACIRDDAGVRDLGSVANADGDKLLPPTEEPSM